MTEEQKADLDKPFVADPAPAGEAPAEAKKEEEKKEVEPAEEEKARVPYSRFENVNKARREAEEEADKWRRRAQELEDSRFERQSETQTGEVPSWWTKLYGDTEQTREAFGIWREGNQQIISQAEQKALEAVKNAQQEEKESERQNLKVLDDHLESVAAIAGHDLSEDEESKILDIIDEFTAKDGDGNYLGAILPPDKAWEIYELKNKVSEAPSKKSRDSVAALTNVPTSGQPSIEQKERDEAYRPGAWGDWEKRLPREQ